VTNVEKLIELVSYAQDNDTYWWEELDSIADATKLLRKAAKARPTKDEIEYLLVLLDVDPFEVNTLPWSYCIKMLEEEIEEE